MREGAVVLSPSHVYNLYPNPFINPPRINLFILTSTYLSIPPLNRLYVDSILTPLCVEIL